jgi:hypothetical protein
MKKIIFLTIFSLKLSLLSQNYHPYFKFFNNQFFFTPFSGIGFRTLHSKKFELEKTYFQTQVPFAMQLKENENLWNLNFNIKIGLRMYNEPNFPVKTPDYQVSVNFFYIIKPRLNTVFCFLHHSNGQKDSVYYLNGELNSETGNFSVNKFQTYWIFLLDGSIFKQFTIHSEHLIFYFSKTYMKTFYYHHALSLSTIFFTKLSKNYSFIYHFNTGFYLQHLNKWRYKLDNILQLQYKNWNLLPFIRIFWGPDEYNSRYIYQNFQISSGISAFIRPFHVISNNEITY